MSDPKRSLLAQNLENSRESPCFDQYFNKLDQTVLPTVKQCPETPDMHLFPKHVSDRYVFVQNNVFLLFANEKWKKQQNEF